MSKATPIVHIGFPKTASTWFQKSFYPHVHAPSYIDRVRVNAAFLTGNALAFDPNRARHLLDLGAGGAGILCEEGLCGYLHNGGVDGAVSKDVADRIKRTLPNARIVIFLRAQPKIIVAAYQQYVRAGGTHGVHRYLFPADHLIGPNRVTYKQPRFDIDFFLYSRLIAYYESLFGPENVHLFLFEQFQREGLDFLGSYAGRLGLDVDWDRVSLAPRHASHGLPLTLFARFLNLFTARSVLDKDHLIHIPGWYRPRRILLEALNRSGLFGAPPSPERMLGKPLLGWIKRHYAPDNRRIAESHGLPLREYGYPMDGEADLIDRPTPGRWTQRLAS